MIDKHYASRLTLLCANVVTVILRHMVAAPAVQAKSTNPSKTKKSVNSVVRPPTEAAPITPTENTVMVTERISASGVARLQRVAAPIVLTKFTKNSWLI